MAGLNMPRAAALWASLRARLVRLLPDSLFGRLALLLFCVALLSHVLALTMMFELRPPPPRPPVGALHGPGAFPPMRPPPGPQYPGMLLDISIRLGAILLAAWFAARWLADPIHKLAAAAQALGTDLARPPMDESGTRECREATRVFNQMQSRILAQIAEREHFVTAVSHDLRTPLTRLALRAESLVDPNDRHRFARDIAEMEEMIGATLSYLRDAADPEAWVELDLASLAESLVDDMHDAGQPVSWLEQDTPRVAQTIVRGQATALRRCLANLVDNAVKYGQQARLALTVENGQVDIHVHDCGQGIAPEQMDQVFRPFVRLESSRNRKTGGVGLGLAIARDIARRHGGDIQLANAPSGMVATLSIPLARGSN